MLNKSEIRSAVEELRVLEEDHKAALYAYNFERASEIATDIDNLVLNAVDLCGGDLTSFWDIYLEENHVEGR